MNPKKMSRRCRGLGLDSGLDLAISHFIYSLDSNYAGIPSARVEGAGPNGKSTFFRQPGCLVACTNWWIFYSVYTIVKGGGAR
jgi:hypothetical protein